LPPRLVDAHNDLRLEVAFRMFRRGESDVFARYWLPHLRNGAASSA
jgi:hypothetical protein